MPFQITHLACPFRGLVVASVLNTGNKGKANFNKRYGFNVSYYRFI